MDRKIEFWQTVADSYRFVFSDWGRFLRLGGAWVAIGVVLFMVLLALFGTDVAAAIMAITKRWGGHVSAGLASARLIRFAYIAVAYTAFAVAWHRTLLLGERRAPLPRFRRREIRFLLYYVGIGLLLVPVLVVFSLLVFSVGLALTVGQSADRHLYMVLVTATTFVVLVAISPFFARLTLGLPAIAIDEPAGVFHRAWHRGEHNGWRLVFGYVVCALPVAVVSDLLMALASLMILVTELEGAWRFVGYAGLVLFYTLSTAAYFLTAATTVTFLSLSYRQLSADEPASPRA